MTTIPGQRIPREPLDTAPEAARVQREVLDRMTPEELVRLSFDASEFVRGLALEGIALRHPEYTLEQRRFALFRLLLGDELFGRAYPGIDVAP